MVRALHPTTIEVTKEEHLTARGDCIIGVGSDKGCAGLSDEVKRALRVDGARVLVRLLVEGKRLEVSCRGDSRLSLSNPLEIVIRRSTYVDARTLAVGADRAAIDIPKEIVERLKQPGTAGLLEIEVTRP